MTGLGSIRHTILQTAMVGAAIMLLATIGLLFAGRVSRSAPRPKSQPVPADGPEPAGRSSETSSGQSGQAEAIEPDDQSAGYSATDPGPAVPTGLGQLPEPAFPPAALPVPGTSPPQRNDDDVAAQRHQVALGDDRIEVVLTEGPFVRWAELPYDVPDDGLAFACIGAGDEGCLFVDLAAAPGAVAITGDTGAANRLAESIVHQLCSTAAADQAISVLVVGSSVPRPHPANATWVETLRDLATAGLDSPPDRTDIVFCELRSDEDALALDHHVASAGHRIVPVVLGHLPGSAWSFTAFGNPPLDGALASLERGARHYS